MCIEHANREELPDTCRGLPAHEKRVARARVLSPYPDALEPSRILFDLRAHAAPFNILTALYFLSSGNHSIAYVTWAIKRARTKHRSLSPNGTRISSEKLRPLKLHFIAIRAGSTEHWKTLERAHGCSPLLLAYPVQPHALLFGPFARGSRPSIHRRGPCQRIQ